MIPNEFILMAALIWALFVHFVVDFMLQRHEIAVNKWNSFPHLLCHAIEYSAGLLVGCSFFMGTQPFYMANLMLDKVFLLAGINGASHLAIDFITSKFSHKYFSKQDWHNGFVVVGFDQFLHTSILIASILKLFDLT